MQAFAERAAGPLPRFHPVQTRGAFPLRRAWEALGAHLLGGSDAATDGSAADDARVAARIGAAPRALLDEALAFAATHRSRFMRPWPDEPHSIAHGILDDETYDWLAVIRGTVTSGGWPLVVDEPVLVEANRIAREATAIPVDATGSAGLAGLLALTARGALAPDENAAVIFSGADRSATWASP
jgi:hypothetical protein